MVMMERRVHDIFTLTLGMAVLLFCTIHEPLVAANTLQFYDQDIFRIVYSTEGVDGISAVDSNNNAVPDRVEDIATQLVAARDAFISLEFPDPLQSKRYTGVTGVMVILRARSSMHGQHGRAFSMATGSRHFSGKWLKIHISTDTNPSRNPTPTHEYFHLIQYGQSRFMNGWYLEGMARWAEDAINKNRVAPDAAIDTEKALSTTYDAADNLWHPLGGACGGPLHMHPSLAAGYAYVDGTPVFKDTKVNGPQAMRNVLTCLHEMEAAAADSFGGVPLWRKNGQRSPQNNSFILECVRATQEQCARRH